MAQSLKVREEGVKRKRRERGVRAENEILEDSIYRGDRKFGGAAVIVTNGTWR